MTIETGTLFDLPPSQQRPVRQESAGGVSVGLATAAIALKELATLSGKSNEAKGLIEAAADPELRKRLLGRMSEAELDEMVARNRHEVLPEHDEGRPIDHRIMRHLGSLTRPAALINAGFDPASVDTMQHDTLDAVNSLVGVDVDARSRAKNIRQINNNLTFDDTKRKTA